jgi:hypothetical protein
MSTLSDSEYETVSTIIDESKIYQFLNTLVDLYHQLQEKKVPKPNGDIKMFGLNKSFIVNDDIYESSAIPLLLKLILSFDSLLTQAPELHATLLLLGKNYPLKEESSQYLKILNSPQTDLPLFKGKWGFQTGSVYESYTSFFICTRKPSSLTPKTKEVFKFGEISSENMFYSLIFSFQLLFKKGIFSENFMQLFEDDFRLKVDAITESFPSLELMATQLNLKDQLTTDQYDLVRAGVSFNFYCHEIWWNILLRKWLQHVMHFNWYPSNFLQTRDNIFNQEYVLDHLKTADALESPPKLVMSTLEIFDPRLLFPDFTPLVLDEVIPIYLRLLKSLQGRKTEQHKAIIVYLKEKIEENDHLSSLFRTKITSLISYFLKRNRKS